MSKKTVNVIVAENEFGEIIRKADYAKDYNDAVYNEDGTVTIQTVDTE